MGVHTSHVTTWSSEVTTPWHLRQHQLTPSYTSLGFLQGPGLASRTFHCREREWTVSKIRVYKSR